MLQNLSIKQQMAEFKKSVLKTNITSLFTWHFKTHSLCQRILMCPPKSRTYNIKPTWEVRFCCIKKRRSRRLQDLLRKLVIRMRL